MEIGNAIGQSIAVMDNRYPLLHWLSNDLETVPTRYKKIVHRLRL
tara:strand:+ start:787 stop:921 length:135 start_codon:yes stop_codon:yes gene_type:complete